MSLVQFFALIYLLFLSVLYFLTAFCLRKSFKRLKCKMLLFLSTRHLFHLQQIKLQFHVPFVKYRKIAKVHRKSTVSEFVMLHFCQAHFIPDKQWHNPDKQWRHQDKQWRHRESTEIDFNEFYLVCLTIIPKLAR